MKGLPKLKHRKTQRIKQTKTTKKKEERRYIEQSD